MKKEFSYFEKDSQWFPIIEVALKHHHRDNFFMPFIISFLEKRRKTVVTKG